MYEIKHMCTPVYFHVEFLQRKYCKDGKSNRVTWCKDSVVKFILETRGFREYKRQYKSLLYCKAV